MDIAGLQLPLSILLKKLAFAVDCKQLEGVYPKLPLTGGAHKGGAETDSQSSQILLLESQTRSVLWRTDTLPNERLQWIFIILRSPFCVKPWKLDGCGVKETLANPCRNPKFILWNRMNASWKERYQSVPTTVRNAFCVKLDRHRSLFLPESQTLCV